MSIKVQFRRKDKLRAKLLRLAPAAEEELRKAVSKSVKEVKAQAQAFAPERSGELIESIEDLTFDDGLSGAVQATAPHAHLVEFPTVHTRAQPFLFPAFRLLIRRIRGRFSRAINKSVKQVARR